MLKRLRIRNLAVVEDVELSLCDGLNVLTGSTGAGKSLILSAVNLLLGEKASADMIRAGADNAEVEAIFKVKRPLSLGDERFAGEVVLRRAITRAGRSHAFVDGKARPIKALREICSQLIEPHGQNEQFRLKDPENHIHYLDEFAGHAPLLSDYATALSSYRDAQLELERFERRMTLLREKRELLQHRIEEIERARVSEGEKAELERRIELMANAERIHETLGNACDVLYDSDDAVAGVLARIRRSLESLARVDDELGAYANALEETTIGITDLAGQMRTFLERIEFDPQDFDRAQRRLDELLELERRYGVDADALPGLSRQWREEIDGLTFEDESRRKLTDAESARAGELSAVGEALHRSRKRAASRLDREMTKLLRGLKIKGAAFRTALRFERDQNSALAVGKERVAAFDNGFDVARFLVRTNEGEAEGGVERIASTGEVSRIALSLKQITAPQRPDTVLVFDEIDAGVGADLGDVIAENLLALSLKYQIISITHMPQIAARAHRHLVVAKSSQKDRVVVGVAEVDSDARLREIARMLGGEEGSDHRIALASELLRKARDSERANRVRP